MDISSLSKNDFDPVEWINEHYKNHVAGRANLTNNDELALDFISTYISKLHLYVERVNYALEECTQQLISTMPRVLKEAMALQDNVQRLQRSMMIMSKEVSQSHENTGDCMSTLERLNSLQMSLQKAKESLQESDGWGNLITELEDHFEKNDLKVCFINYYFINSLYFITFKSNIICLIIDFLECL